MILNNVSNGARLVVKSPPSLNAEIFRHRDLYTGDVVAVPERFQDGVGEPEEEHIVHRPFPEIVIDSEDRGLVESTEQSLIERSRRGQAMTERSLDDDAGARCAISCGQLFDDSGE